MIGVLFISLVVVTGYVGQVALMQMALAGVSAFAVGTFSTDARLRSCSPSLRRIGCWFWIDRSAPSLRTRGASWL